MLAPFVVGREARGVGGLCDLALEDFLQGIDALARDRVCVAHEMHLDLCLDAGRR